MWKAALLLSLLCTACRSEERDGPAGTVDPAATPSAAQLSNFETQAVQACRCSRRPGADKEVCWKDFDRAVSVFDPGEEFTMCDGITTRATCFGPDQNTCMTLDYGAGACTPEEARQLVPIYQSTPFDRRDAAVEEAIERLDRGETLAAGPAEATGC